MLLSLAYEVYPVLLHSQGNGSLQSLLPYLIIARVPTIKEIAAVSPVKVKQKILYGRIALFSVQIIMASLFEVLISYDPSKNADQGLRAVFKISCYFPIGNFPNNVL